jgi:iron complex transport system substrate-binding protein
VGSSWRWRVSGWILAAALAAPPVTAATPPRRIVALAPSAAEILFALGAASRVVGVPDTARDLPDSSGKTLIGGFTPDLERLIALAPDLVVVSRDGTDRSAYEKVVELGLPTLVTQGRTLDGVFEDIGAVGRAVGEEKRAKALVASCRSRVLAARERTRLLSREHALPSVLVVIWPDPPVVAGPRSFVGDLLTQAGLANVVPETAGEWPRVSFETLAAWDPGLLVRPETPENGEAFRRVLGSDPRWKLVPAARNGKVVVIPGAWLERPGPRLVDALEALVAHVSRGRS